MGNIFLQPLKTLVLVLLYLIQKILIFSGNHSWCGEVSVVLIQCQYHALFQISSLLFIRSKNTWWSAEIWQDEYFPPWNKKVHSKVTMIHQTHLSRACLYVDNMYFCQWSYFHELLPHFFHKICNYNSFPTFMQMHTASNNHTYVPLIWNVIKRFSAFSVHTFQNNGQSTEAMYSSQNQQSSQNINKLVFD